MSGYFASLMRSSGMPFAGRATVVAHVEPLVAEVDIERSPVPAAWPRAAQAVSTPQPASAPLPSADSVGPPPAPAGRSAPTRAHQERGQPVGTGAVEPRAAVHPAVDPPAMSTVEASRPALNQALVRAAMQWVAADPQQVRAAARTVPLGQLSTSGDIASTVGTTLATDDRDRETTVRPLSAVQATAAAPDLQARDPLPTQLLPVPLARQTASAPPTPVAPLHRDEVVEISIGAIHVRVDAPAAHTTATPATPPPTAAPSDKTAGRARSGLERRALRRI